MTDLPPSAAALLETARSDHNPSQGDRERVHAALFSALSLPLASPDPTLAAHVRPQSPAPPVSVAGSFGVGVKLAVIAGLSLGAVSLWSLRDPPGRTSSSRTPAPVSAAQSSAAESPAPATRANTSVETTAAPAAELPAAALALQAGEETSAVRSARREQAQRRNAARALGVANQDAVQARAVDTSEASLPATGTLGGSAATGESGSASQDVPSTEARAPRASAYAELMLIRRAVSALNAGATDTALRALAEHRSAYPSGTMASECEGLFALALCEGGQLEAGRRQQAEFLRRFPESPLAARVRAACQGGPR